MTDRGLQSPGCKQHDEDEDMKAFGTCPKCKEWGALWPVERLVRRFWIFGPLVPHKVYRCDECEMKP